MARASVSATRRLGRPRDGGFSLVELIIAMMIIAVVIIMLIGVQISAALTVTEARKVQQATALANEAVEQMRAIPWHILVTGMYSGFETSPNPDDPLVTSGVLQVPGHPDLQVLVASPSANQDLNNPWLPIFDEDGSNRQERNDPSLAGVIFVVKAYITEGLAASSGDTLGVVAVVEWPGRNGVTSRTMVRSTVYRSGCGDSDTQPYLAACQEAYEASAGTGTVRTDLSASNVAADPADVEPRPLMTPGENTEYVLGVRTATTTATLRSQQVNVLDAMLEYGGTLADDNDPVTAPVSRGFARWDLKATDDVTQQGQWPSTATFVGQPIIQTGSAEQQATISHASSPIQILARSDFGRRGEGTGTVSGACVLGIPSAQPCSAASLANNSNSYDGAGYIWMELESTTFRLSRRLSNLSGTNGNVETSWTARFVSAPGAAAVGCTTVTGSGCVSAGATRTMATLSIGDVSTGTGSWNGEASDDGIVVIQGRAGCGTGSYYTESVLVQRGVSQLATAPAVTRCGAVKYWTGSGYTTFNFDHTTLATLDTDPVEWTSGIYRIEAVAQVSITPSYTDATGSADCVEEACTVSAAAGDISVVVTYYITWGSHEHYLISTTNVAGSSASATYQAVADD